MSFVESFFMPAVRFISPSKTLSSTPRLGFLLFILALAIVIWPRLRSAQEIDTKINSSRLESNLAHLKDEAGSPMISSDKTAQEPESIGSITQGDVKSSANESDDNLAIDGQTRDLLSIVIDNTLRMSKREMPAYWALVRKSSIATFQRLREQATTKLKFNDFYTEPSKHRGELVALDVTIRRVTRYEVELGSSAGVNSVYEIWGSTEQSQSWLYVFITDTLPDGFTEVTFLRKRVEFAGYFMKLLAYQPGGATPSAKPLLAPLLIGRFDNVQPTDPVSKSASYGLATWGPSLGIATLTVYFSFRVFWTADRKGRKRRGSGNVLSESNLTE